MTQPDGEIDPEIAMKSDLEDYFADLRTYRMPFGRYKGRLIHTLPHEYLHWFVERSDGFPNGRLGELMDFVYQTKHVGAEAIFAQLPRF